MESTKEVLVVKSDNLVNENAKITGGFGGGIVYGSPLFPLPKLIGNFGRNIKFSIKAGVYSLRTFVGDGTVTKDNCLGIYLQDNSGNELQGINSPANNGINKVSTFTVSEDVASKTTQLYIFFNHDVAGTTYEKDTFNGIMINSGDTGKDYEPYYHEYESTKEVFVRRSSNLLYFQSNLNGDLYKTKPFRNNGITFTKTIDDVHFEGEWDGTENTSGSWGIAYCNIVLAAGTYTLSNDENYQGQTIINKNVDNAWVTVAQCGYGSHTKTFTLTEPTVIGRLFWSNANMDKNVPIDMWMHPMLVEGDTAQDYEPYYYEAEASKLITWAVDDTLVSVMDFSNMLYNKFIDNSGNIVQNALWATTANFSPCTGNTAYWYNANMINYYPIGRSCRFVFYDENKQLIGMAGTSSGKEDKSVTSPANARYMKASISRFSNNDFSQPFPIKPIVYIK